MTKLCGWSDGGPILAADSVGPGAPNPDWPEFVPEVSIPPTNQPGNPIVPLPPVDPPDPTQPPCAPVWCTQPPDPPLVVCDPITDPVQIAEVMNGWFMGYYPEIWRTPDGYLNFPDVRFTSGLAANQYAACNNGANFWELNYGGDFGDFLIFKPDILVPPVEMIVPPGDHKKLELVFEIMPNLTGYDLERNGSPGITPSTAFALFIENTNFTTYILVPIARASAPSGLFWVDAFTSEVTWAGNALDLDSGNLYYAECYVDGWISGSAILRWGVRVNDPDTGLPIEEEPGRVVKLHSVRLFSEQLLNPVSGVSFALDSFTNTAGIPITAHVGEDGKTWDLLLVSSDPTDNNVYGTPIIFDGISVALPTAVLNTYGVFRREGLVGIDKRFVFTGSWYNTSPAGFLELLWDWNGQLALERLHVAGMTAKIRMSGTNNYLTISGGGSDGPNLALTAPRGSLPYRYTVTIQENSDGYSVSLVSGGSTVSGQVKKYLFDPDLRRYFGVQLYKGTSTSNRPALEHLQISQTIDAP